MTMGADFQYENAAKWFTNLDKLIKYVNMVRVKHQTTSIITIIITQNGSVNAMYSTPSIYLRSLNKEFEVAWPTKDIDFFPYADNPWSYWSGNYYIAFWLFCILSCQVILPVDQH